MDFRHCDCGAASRTATGTRKPGFLTSGNCTTRVGQPDMSHVNLLPRPTLRSK